MILWTHGKCLHAQMHNNDIASLFHSFNHLLKRLPLRDLRISKNHDVQIFNNVINMMICYKICCFHDSYKIWNIVIFRIILENLCACKCSQ